MNLVISPHNLTLTKAIEDHVRARIQQIEHFNRYVVGARVVLVHNNSKANERTFKCSMRLEVPGPDLFAEDEENDLYVAVDMAAKKIEQQLRTRHNRFKARKHNVPAQHKRQQQETGL